MKYLYLVLSMLTACFAVTTAEAATKAEADACFSQALLAAKSGSTLKELVDKYIDIPSVAAQASHIQRRGFWADLSPKMQGIFIDAVITYVSESKSFDSIQLDSVTTNPNRGKQLKNSFELPGQYIDRLGQSNTFVFRIVATPRCRIIDAAWNNAWLSRNIPLP
jgi:hypothetical protein